MIVAPRDDDTCSSLGVRPFPPGTPAPPVVHAPSTPATAATKVGAVGGEATGEGWPNDPTETRRHRLPPRTAEPWRHGRAVRASSGGTGHRTPPSKG